MILKEVIKTEEVREREVSLPFYFRTVDCVGELFVQIVNEELAVVVRTDEQISGKIAQISCTTAERGGSYPVVEELSADAWEAAYFRTDLYIKRQAIPGYVLDPLTDEEKDQFQYSY